MVTQAEPFETTPSPCSEPLDKLNLFGLMAEDVRTALERDPAARTAFEVATTYAGVHALWGHRVSHWMWTHGMKWLARAFAQFARFLTGVEIHPGACIARRFFIDHGMGVVIGETAVIQEDVTIYHNVTLGGVSLVKIKRHPTIEPGVVIGAGAKVLGDITVGSHSRIGANAVVIKSVPPQSVVVGVPGQIIRRKQTDTGRKADLSHTDLPDAIVNALQGVIKRLDTVESRLDLHQSEQTDMHLEPDGIWEYVETGDYVI